MDVLGKNWYNFLITCLIGLTVKGLVMELDVHKPTILVTGGAGYIGSNAAFLLSQQGYQVVIIDNFKHGQQFYPDWARVIKCDFSDQSILDQIFTHYNVEAVMHFAGLIEVGASVRDPKIFYEENVVKVLKLLNKMQEHGIDKFVFSSSAAVYGTPTKVPIVEEHPCNPINPYGNTKYAVECMLSDFSRAYGLNFVALRYFNAAGADVENGLGERHKPETHVIPLLLEAAQSGETFSIFGNDYQTPDGTCIRDYLHVKDLASAHYKALKFLDGNKSAVFNLGTGIGASVSELVNMVTKQTGLSINVEVKKRRSGDPDRLVADPSRASTLLGWKPEYSSLETIIADAWLFYQKPDAVLYYSDQSYQQSSVF